MISKIHQAKIDYRALQLTRKLTIPDGFAFENVKNPETLQEIGWKQNARRGLKIVSDETFNFFQSLYS